LIEDARWFSDLLDGAGQSSVQGATRHRIIRRLGLIP
jgi:hypothetical protein